MNKMTIKLLFFVFILSIFISGCNQENPEEMKASKAPTSFGEAVRKDFPLSITNDKDLDDIYKAIVNYGQEHSWSVKGITSFKNHISPSYMEYVSKIDTNIGIKYASVDKFSSNDGSSYWKVIEISKKEEYRERMHLYNKYEQDDKQSE